MPHRATRWDRLRVCPFLCLCVCLSICVSGCCFVLSAVFFRHVGELYTSSAPYDPLFWVIHPTAERLMGWRRKLAVEQPDEWAQYNITCSSTACSTTWSVIDIYLPRVVVSERQPMIPVESLFEVHMYNMHKHVFTYVRVGGWTRSWLKSLKICWFSTSSIIIYRRPTCSWVSRLLVLYLQQLVSVKTRSHSFIESRLRQKKHNKKKHFPCPFILLKNNFFCPVLSLIFLSLYTQLLLLL